MTTAHEIEIFADAHDLADAVAHRFVSAANAAIQARGEFIVALSGGATPRPVYARLAAEPCASRLDWSRIQFAWCDERCVPPNHESSNFRMVRETLLDEVDVPEANVHRIRGEDDPAHAAATYERVLRAVLRTPSGPPRTAPGSRLDFVLLGLGNDGHTASLFPGATSLQANARWVAAEYVHTLSSWRVTLTTSVINAAAQIAFVVSGVEKAEIVRNVLESPNRQEPLPAQLIVPVDGRVFWLLDVHAAAKLRHVPR
jgi:6-phosphogluconolactonase